MIDYSVQQDMSLPLYPLDMTFAFALAGEMLGANGVPYHKLDGPQPLTVAYYALAHWNAYLATHQEDHRQAFLIQVRWLTSHARLIGDRAAGWPIPVPPASAILQSRTVSSSLSNPSPLCLSATIQACSLSVLLRAYLLTQESRFLQLAQLVFATFQFDILDGGVASPVSEQGFWFEEYALYPAFHTLGSMLFSLLACYECSAFSSIQAPVTSVFAPAFSTLRSLLPEFDAGCWVRYDLLQSLFLTPEQLALYIQLLTSLADLTGDSCTAQYARRWQRYLLSPQMRLHYRRSIFCQKVGQKALALLRTLFFPRRPACPGELRVCVPITAFPLTGGMRTILGKLEESMQDGNMRWQMTYMTQRVGPQTEGYHIRRFGLHWFSPRQFPLVWGYVLAGGISLFWSLFTGAGYDLVLPQDGLFTAAFAAPLARLAGIRVVCIDHGNLAALSSQLYRQERLQSLDGKHWFRRFLEPWLFFAYWPSLQVLARVSARFVDCYAIPGVPGDGIESICQLLGVPASRLVRFVNTIDVGQYCLQEQADRALLRAQRGLASDAIVITTICRLSPEKGVEIALQAMSQALSLLSPALCARVRFIIAGDGVLRPRLEEQIRQLGLDLTCMLWGEISPAEARLLHMLSDVYVYSGTRGGGYSLVMLEAMAAASAVLASDVPLANVQMLANERGLVVSAGDVAQTAQALVRLIEDEDLRLKLGRRARKYVSQYNTIELFQRLWLRVSCWSDLNGFVGGLFLEIERQENV